MLTAEAYRVGLDGYLRDVTGRSSGAFANDKYNTFITQWFEKRVFDGIHFNVKAPAPPTDLQQPSAHDPSNICGHPPVEENTKSNSDLNTSSAVQVSPDDVSTHDSPTDIPSTSEGDGGALKLEETNQDIMIRTRSIMSELKSLVYQKRLKIDITPKFPRTVVDENGVAIDGSIMFKFPPGTVIVYEAAYTTLHVNYRLVLASIDKVTKLFIIDITSRRMASCIVDSRVHRLRYNGSEFVIGISEYKNGINIYRYNGYNITEVLNHRSAGTTKIRLENYSILTLTDGYCVCLVRDDCTFACALVKALSDLDKSLDWIEADTEALITKRLSNALVQSLTLFACFKERDLYLSLLKKLASPAVLIDLLGDWKSQFDKFNSEINGLSNSRTVTPLSTEIIDSTTDSQWESKIHWKFEILKFLKLSIWDVVKIVSSELNIPSGILDAAENILISIESSISHPTSTLQANIELERIINHFNTTDDTIPPTACNLIELFIYFIDSTSPVTSALLDKDR